MQMVSTTHCSPCSANYRQEDSPVTLCPTAQVRGESLGGGKMRISRINGVGVDISGMYSTLFVAHKDVPGVLAALTNLLAYAHVNIAFCRTYRTEVGGQAYSVFETDGTPDDTVVPMLRKLDNVDYATFKEGRIVGLPARGEKLRDDEDVRLIVV